MEYFTLSKETFWYDITRLGMELILELETRNQVENDTKYKFFYATMCHVYKRFGYDVSLKWCICCKMIFYCSEDHQKLHWQQPKSLCKAIRDTVREYNTEDVTLQEWDIMKLKFMNLVKSKLKPDLPFYEKKMFLFPR